MVKIEKTRFDKEHGTDYFKIEDLSNWDLERLYRLLVAETERSKIVEGFDRGCPKLLEQLTVLAKERKWKI